MTSQLTSVSAVAVVSTERHISEQLYYLPSQPLNKHIPTHLDIYMHPLQGTFLWAPVGCLIMEKDA